MQLSADTGAGSLPSSFANIHVVSGSKEKFSFSSADDENSYLVHDGP